jgi:serine/threonine-protein kinase
VGSRFAERYGILDKLGGGATGNVYAAHDDEHDRDVALKVIHPHLVGNRQVSQRFHREAAILRRLTSPNIVRVHDFGEDRSGLLFLALERLEGQRLSSLIDQELRLEMVVEIMAGICRALIEAHGAGVIHRDLKPDNVVVDLRDGRIARVAVLDFGLSKVLQGGGLESTNLTEQNMVLGTPEYMAPEQARGDEVDERCDIYAAGVILYQLLTGSVPFSRRTPVAVMTAHMTEAPAPPSLRPSRRSIPTSLAAVATHALAKRRRDRYPTAAALAAALAASEVTPDDPASVHPPAPQRESLPVSDVELADTLPVELELNASALGMRPRARRWRVPPWVWVALFAGIAGALIGVWFSTRF